MNLFVFPIGIVQDLMKVHVVVPIETKSTVEFFQSGRSSSLLGRTTFCHLFNTVVNKISFDVPGNPAVVTEGDI